MLSPAAVAVRGLFQRRIAGDEALLGLAALRFRQAGMGAELYADAPEDLERVLRFVPPSGVLPTVHLDRRLDVLTIDGRETVSAFARRFAGRVAGLVVHDRPAMAERLDATALALRAIGERSGEHGPMIFLEFAGGLAPPRFVDLAAMIADEPRASVCVDVGHVGIRQARLAISEALGSAGAPALWDPDLARVIDPIVAATSSALPAVTDLIDALGAIEKPVHVHLHDGHPLTSGLADHLSFLSRVPIPFEHEGRYALSPLYGPGGLATILAHAQRMRAQPSYTLEIHQVEGRLALQDARPMFAHWVDLTNAERMNYWLSVLAENHLLASTLLSDPVLADPVLAHGPPVAPR